MSGTAPAPGAPPLLRADSLLTAAVLSAGTGLLDAFAYLGHGHAFASFMTGNMVLLGLHAVSGGSLAIYCLPIAAYVAGVVLANAIGRGAVRRALGDRPQVFTLAVEIIVLGGLAVVPHHLDDRTLVSLVTVSTAVQNTSFRALGRRVYNSAFMTGNLQNFSGILAEGLLPPDRARLREAFDLGAVILAFFAGAVLGGLLTPRLDLLTLLVPASALALLGLALLCPRPLARI